MQTAIIWNEIDSLRCAKSDDDLSKFNGIYCNSREPNDFYSSNGSHEELTDELAKISENFEFITLDDFVLLIRQDTECKVIECGFLP